MRLVQCVMLWVGILIRARFSSSLMDMKALMCSCVLSCVHFRIGSLVSKLSSQILASRFEEVATEKPYA